MATIELRALDGSVRARTIVDDEDYDGLAQHRWHLGRYVQRTVRHSRFRAEHMPFSAEAA